MESHNAIEGNSKTSDTRPKKACAQLCPKFNTCNAPICPIDSDWAKRKHVSGDKCCIYLLEASKADAKATFEGAGLCKLREAIAVVQDNILCSYGAIKQSSSRAETTPSRLNPTFSRVKAL